MNRDINAAVAVFLRDREAADSELVEKFEAVVKDRDLAERLVEFVPLAFGRVVLQRIGVTLPENFKRMMANGKFTHECALTLEPLWEPALAFAKDAEGRISKEDFLVIAGRSAEVDAANKAMQAGFDPKHLVGSTPIFMRAAPMPGPPAKKRKWWMFWRKKEPESLF